MAGIGGSFLITVQMYLARGVGDMAEYSNKWELRSVRRLAIAVILGLALFGTVLAWPSFAQGESPPVITRIEVTSSESPFLYSPSLNPEGGTVYFNNLPGLGEDQILTVTVTVSDDNASIFAGGFAFGVAPTTTISDSSGITSTWSVTYLVRAADVSENGVLFTIADTDNLTDSARITFTQDITAPEIQLLDVTDPKYDPDGNELNATGNWYRTSALVAGWSFTAVMTETGVGYASGQADWNHQNDNSNDQSITPIFNDSDTLNGTFTDVDTNSDGLVLFTLAAADRVGNEGSIPVVGLNLDDTPPDTSLMQPSYLPDTDSGQDGISPNTSYYDDPTIDLQWPVPPDSGGSGASVYTLTTNLSPFTSATYYSDQATGLLSGTLNVMTDGANSVRITVADHVGNVSEPSRSTNPFIVDTDPPVNGELAIVEDEGPEYLYISPWEHITTGTLFYNNIAPSSFIAKASGTSWGNSDAWYVEFGTAWSNPTFKDYSSLYEHAYDINSSEVDDSFTVKFVNNAGNVQPITISTVLDTEGPLVVFTDVTDPDYDPDGDELDGGNPDDNWYRTSGLNPAGWHFTTDVSDTLSGVRESIAQWNPSVVTESQSIPAPGGDGTFLNVYDDGDGPVQVMVEATDQVNNTGSATLEIQLDGTPPSMATNPWTESSSYLSLQGDVLYFNAAMPTPQHAIVSGSTADGSGSGMDHVAFEQKPQLSSVPITQSITSSWSGDYQFSSATGVGTDTVQVTAYDHVGNHVADAYVYRGVNTQPGVAFVDVTRPGYDAPPDNPLDDLGNWYAEQDLNAPPGSSSWWFQALVTPADNVGIVAASATWDHEAGAAYHQTIYPTLLSNTLEGTFANVSNDPSGLVTVTVTITDDLNRVASDTLLLRIDNQGPDIADDGWTENSEYLYADGSTLYFSHQMGTTGQTGTLSGLADDGANGSGLDSIAFSFPETLGPSQPDPSLPDWSIQYFVSNSSTGTGSPVQVTVRDHLENQTARTYAYVQDTVSPSVPGNFRITTAPVIPGYYNVRPLNLAWNGSTDNLGGSGLLGYYLGTATPPSDFYPPSTTTTAFDTDADGVFTLYLEARDRVHNVSLVSTGPITVDTEAPVSFITASPEEASRRFLVEWNADDVTTWAERYDVEYRVNGGSWASWLPNTTLTSKYFGPDSPVSVQTGNLYEFRVRARDHVNNQGDWSRPWGGSLTRRFVFLPLIINNFDASIPFATFDGFETGKFVGWKTSGALPSSIVTSPLPPNGGSYAALLGNPGYGCGDSPNIPIGQASLQAYAQVPASGTPYLRFSYRVRSYDTVRDSSGEWWDRLEVRVNNDVLARYGDPDPGNLNCGSLFDSGWQAVEFNLSAYKGQTVVLTFFNENHGDHYWNTYSYLDNIRIEVGP
jgi:hypothetical protein